MLPKIQVPPPVDRAMVRHLDNPGSSRTLLGVKMLCSLGEIEKDFLAEIVCFRFISENSVGNMKYGAGMPTEEEPKSIPRSLTYGFKEGFI
ncbi:hypothetical protein HDF15_003329 [Granulicella mallensis]|uniref:Uncharacterized protein n=1 Tax=Granulicella mallensis TaxID=940614 RepID=A0A7W8EAM6_9BACT|nr:hypothetical protein [Granulicella mallensis]